jgi:hypothetical protein
LIHAGIKWWKREDIYNILKCRTAQQETGRYIICKFNALRKAAWYYSETKTSKVHSFEFFHAPA